MQQQHQNFGHNWWVEFKAGFVKIWRPEPSLLLNNAFFKFKKKKKTVMGHIDFSLPQNIFCHNNGS